MSTYIDGDDITDLMMLDFKTQSLATFNAKLEKSDKVVEDLAQRKGVKTANIKADDSGEYHYLIKEYAIAWFGMSICFDAWGKNNVDIIQSEKYGMKYKAYKSQMMDLAGQITPEVFLGTVNDPVNRAGFRSGAIYRTS